MPIGFEKRVSTARVPKASAPWLVAHTPHGYALGRLVGCAVPLLVRLASPAVRHKRVGRNQTLHIEVVDEMRCVAAAEPDASKAPFACSPRDHRISLEHLPACSEERPNRSIERLHTVRHANDSAVDESVR